jgi:CheY-like chemotaxis protein
VRSSLAGRQIRLIAVTGYARAEGRAAVIKAGFDAHIVTQLISDELVRRLATRSAFPG